MPSTNNNHTFDKAQRQLSWNLTPQCETVIPASTQAIGNAAKAIAICAYPQSNHLRMDGKAHKYAQALIAYLFRASQWTGEIERLPLWVSHLKIERMWNRLRTGNRNLIRAFVIRDLISSALVMRMQHDQHSQGVRSTFLLQFSDNLKSIKIDMPVKKTTSGDLYLCGKIPSKGRSSIRQAVTKHKAALLPFAGPSPRVDGWDDELFYQNVLNRFVRPALQTSHITQIVWEAANTYRKESDERKLPIDQILMRKATWAEDLYAKANRNESMTILNMQELGIATCSCKLVHIGYPSPDF